MFQDKSFVEQTNTPHHKVNGLLRDISCGSRCLQNDFLSNTDTLKIILFQDARNWILEEENLIAHRSFVEITCSW